MGKYHAGSNGRALCGASGKANGFHVVVLPAAQWNKLEPAQRCQRCVEHLRLRNLRSSK